MRCATRERIQFSYLRPEKDRSANLMPADGTRVICPHADFGTSRRDVQFYPAAYSRKAINCSVIVRGMTGWPASAATARRATRPAASAVRRTPREGRRWGANSWL